jgi:hypothetical protein
LTAYLAEHGHAQDLNQWTEGKKVSGKQNNVADMSTQANVKS